MDEFEKIVKQASVYWQVVVALREENSVQGSRPRVYSRVIVVRSRPDTARLPGSWEVLAHFEIDRLEAEEYKEEAQDLALVLGNMLLAENNA